MNTATTVEWARLLRAVAHPIRLRILKELVKGTKCVNDIRELVDLPQPNVSQHLAQLKASRLVTSYKQGVRRCYALSNPALIEGLFAALEVKRAVAPCRVVPSVLKGRPRGVRTR